uniref:Histone-lysine N-methyltransferase, H3 lysine-79 specific n=1 Tax=Aplanochytrium stocchinoi TaxID=215587 RepID=A0A7S3V0H0_9STRA|mmetsp:Transcript_657/g.790  ORF Transcript_657/g.790 Transcript_657/m.790 type:complete len:270 (-) Transcript_657:96-905(-)
MVTVRFVLLIFVCIKFQICFSIPSSLVFKVKDQKSCNITVLADIPPPLRKGETLESRQRIDEILYWHWPRRRTSIVDDHKGKLSHNVEENDRGIQYTYGEVTPLGVRQLISAMGLYVKNNNIVFFDLGSGYGKLAAQMFLENVSNVVVGVELSRERHSIAMQSWKAVQRTLGLEDSDDHEKQRLYLVNRDALDTDFGAATHIYISSLCFPTYLKQSLGRKIANNAKNGHLKIVATLSDFQVLEEGGWRKATHYVQMTWGNSLVRVYEKL